MIRALLLTTAALSAAQAQTFSTLATFTQTGAPISLIVGADGNFYAPTYGPYVPGGLLENPNGGSIVRITPSGAITVLYTFPSAYPNSLLEASDGNFYGTSPNAPGPQCPKGCGSVFKLTPAGSLTTLYSFSGPDGLAPSALVQGADGNFYGGTVSGGTSYSDTQQGYGTIFQISASGVFNALHSFQGSDGSGPAALIQASDGTFYGITTHGGSGNCQSNFSFDKGCGTIFKITPSGEFSSLYSFDGTESATPLSIVPGADGNFYGTNWDGTATLFEITPSGAFTPFDLGSANPDPASFIQGTKGTFFGTSYNGGTGNCPTVGLTGPSGCGTIFQFTPPGSLTTLYSFAPVIDTSTGVTFYESPEPGPIIQTPDGNLYGVTNSGGTNEMGSFYELTLVAPNAPEIARSGGVVNGATFQSGISPGSWFTIQGTNLSSVTDNWNNAIVNGALPTKLDGVSVMVGGEPAYIAFVSPTQINALAPNVATGTVAVTVTTSIATSQPVNAQVLAEQPAFFQWGTYAVATHQDFSYAVKNGAIAGLTTVPAKPGEVIILWGTGFGPTSPAAPAGAETPTTTTYNTATPVTVTIGNQTATVYGAALAPGFAGLYQIAIQVPASLANGDYPVVATINGASSPATTMMTLQQ